MGELHVVLGSCCHGLLALTAVVELALQVAVLLLSLLSEGSLAVGASLFGFSLLAQGVGAVVERGYLSGIKLAQLARTAPHEIVAHCGKGIYEILGSHLLAVEQPVHLALQTQCEPSAHVSLDMERGGDEELVELLVAVGRRHLSGDGHRGIVADVQVAEYRCGGLALGDGVAHPHAVFVAAGEGSSHARAQPDVEPLGLAVGP